MEDVILGISLGTRQCGIAVFKNRRLYDWRIKTYHENWSGKKLKKILSSIEKIIHRESVSCIACKSPTEYIELSLLLNELKKVAVKNNIRFHLYPIKEIKQTLHEDIFNKEKLAEYVTNQCPELLHHMNRHRANKNKYQMKIFEAVAVGLCVLKK